MLLSCVRVAVVHVDVERTVLPEPDLLDAQATVGLELVDPSARPDDLDGEVRGLARLIRPDEVALVGLDTGLLCGCLQRPGAGR